MIPKRSPSCAAIWNIASHGPTIGISTSERPPSTPRSSVPSGTAASKPSRSPHYPSKIARDGPEETARLYREVASHLEAATADAIVVFANDHFNTFFLDNFPTFAIGIANTSFGPNDQTKMPRYDLKVQSTLAAHIRNVGIREGFDLAVAGEFGVDHAMLVPLHYLTDGVKTPMVPIWVNA